MPLRPSNQDDVAATKRVLDQQDGPAILVGHSYGGVVITEAGNHPKVAALVYVAAFAPDEGESVASLIANPPPGAPVPPILPPQDGFLLLDRAKFADAFAADLDPKVAAFRADSQVPWGVAALEGAVGQPAWRSKPSWYLVATDDKMIPPPAQHTMSTRAGASVSEVKASHAHRQAISSAPRREPHSRATRCASPCTSSRRRRPSRPNASCRSSRSLRASVELCRCGRSEWMLNARRPARPSCRRHACRRETGAPSSRAGAP
jgi:hypothetical protein